MTENSGNLERSLLEEAELRIPHDSLWIANYNNHVYRVLGHVALPDKSDVDIIYVPEGHARPRYRTYMSYWLQEVVDPENHIVSRFTQIELPGVEE